MALVTADYFRPLRAQGLNAIPTLEVAKEAATVIYKGSVLIATSGYAVIATDGPTTGTVIGVAIEAITAAQGRTTVKMCPAFPNVLFQGNFGTGDTGGTYSPTVANMFIGHGVSLDSTNVWYINQADTTDKVVRAVDLIDDSGTAWGAVEFHFCDSAWTLNT